MFIAKGAFRDFGTMKQLLDLEPPNDPAEMGTAYARSAHLSGERRKGRINLYLQQLPL